MFINEVRRNYPVEKFLNTIAGRCDCPRCGARGRVFPGKKDYSGLFHCPGCFRTAVMHPGRRHGRYEKWRTFNRFVKDFPRTSPPEGLLRKAGLSPFPHDPVRLLTDGRLYAFTEEISRLWEEVGKGGWKNTGGTVKGPERSSYYQVPSLAVPAGTFPGECGGATIITERNHRSVSIMRGEELWTFIQVGQSDEILTYRDLLEDWDEICRVILVAEDVTIAVTPYTSTSKEKRKKQHSSQDASTSH